MLENLISFICDELGCDESEVGGETLLCDLVGDELEIEELVQALENEFDVEISGGISGDASVEELAEMIDKDS